MVQFYSTGDGNVSFHKAHWRHLANTIELVHPSAHSRPQSKRQMDRFSRFCTAYGRKCLCFTMGASIHQNCPFQWGIWTSDVTRDAFGPYEPTTQTAPRSAQPSLHRWARGVSIVYKGLPVSPSKLLLPMLASGPHVIHGSLGPPESGTLMVTWSFQPFSAGLTSVTHWQSDRSSYRQTTLLGAMRRNNA